MIRIAPGSRLEVDGIIGRVQEVQRMRIKGMTPGARKSARRYLVKALMPEGNIRQITMTIDHREYKVTTGKLKEKREEKTDE